MEKKSILCIIGFHKWGKKHGHNQYSSNVIEWKQVCSRCGAIHRWIEAKKEKN
jgi:hypothetical protein